MPMFMAFMSGSGCAAFCADAPAPDCEAAPGTRQKTSDITAMMWLNHRDVRAEAAFQDDIQDYRSTREPGPGLGEDCS